MLTSVLDGRVFGERVGATPARVLALHGWGRDRTDLLPVLTGVAGLALDLPGFGASPPPDLAWGTGTRDYAAALAPLLDDAAVMRAPVVLVGHSFGGRVALHLAAARPDAVAGLVLTGTPSLVTMPGAAGSRSPLTYRLARAANRRGLVSDARMNVLRERYGSADYRAARGVLREVLVRAVNERYDDVLASVRCPVTLVWGEFDTAAPVVMARIAVERFATATLQVIPGSAHLLDERLYAALRTAVQAFVPGDDAAGRGPADGGAA